MLLTRQFRYPVYVNDHADGMLIEAAAGLLDDDAPEAAIRREAIEETGHEVGEIEHVFDVYMSPGSVTERLHFYAAPYSRRDGAARGRRHSSTRASRSTWSSSTSTTRSAQIGTEIVDAKTIMLLQWAALRGPFAGSGAPCRVGRP